jgi:hypothetical protein
MYLGARLTYPGQPLLRAVAPFLIAAALLFWLLPPVGLALALAGVAPGLLTWAATACVLAAGFWALISFGMGAPMWYGLLFPLGAATTLVILLRSVLRGARRVEWRGRVYDEVSATVREHGAPASGHADRA